MTTQLEQIRDQQQATWDKFSAGWKKWDELAMGWLRPVGEALLESARLRPDSAVVDIATGTGEPGLTAAERCPQGRVTLTDLSEKMLAVAAENAARRGLGNVETRQADAGALPFGDASFDAVIARFGFMFFPDMAATARELARVARPGGAVTTAVWAAPAKNPWATVIMSTIAAHVEMPTPPPGAPGLFRCAEPGMLAAVFRDAGLTDVTEVEVGSELRFASPTEYFQFMTEIAAPVVAGLGKADGPTRERIEREVLAKAEATGAVFRWAATVVTGTRT
jgi:ubiquinone/menaquinone biosynthesis C-methylase UbiE